MDASSDWDDDSPTVVDAGVARAAARVWERGRRGVGSDAGSEASAESDVLFALRALADLEHDTLDLR